MASKKPSMCPHGAWASWPQGVRLKCSDGQNSRAPDGIGKDSCWTRIQTQLFGLVIPVTPVNERNSAICQNWKYTGHLGVHRQSYVQIPLHIQSALKTGTRAYSDRLVPNPNPNHPGHGAPGVHPTAAPRGTAPAAARAEELRDGDHTSVACLFWGRMPLSECVQREKGNRPF